MKEPLSQTLHMHINKFTCKFGWDWFPRINTCSCQSLFVWYNGNDQIAMFKILEQLRKIIPNWSSLEINCLYPVFWYRVIILFRAHCLIVTATMKAVGSARLNGFAARSNQMRIKILSERNLSYLWLTMIIGSRLTRNTPIINWTSPTCK